MIYYTVLKDWKDIQTYTQGKQLDMMEMLTSNLGDFEEITSRLRKLLKTRELAAFLDDEKNVFRESPRTGMDTTKRKYDRRNPSCRNDCLVSKSSG